MTGKTTFMLNILSKLSNFDPSPSHIHCFGNINLKQFDVLIQQYGSDFVDINPVSKIPGFEFKTGAMVLVDEFNNSLLSLKRKEQITLFSTIKKILSETCHHRQLYFCIILQDILRTDCYNLTRLAQSLSIGTKNGHSIDLVRRLGIMSPTLKAKVIAAIRMFSKQSMFLLIYTVPSADDSFIYNYIWSYLTYLPSFAIAIKLQSDIDPPKAHSKVRIQQLTMADQLALEEILECPVPLELAGEMYVFVPFDAVKRDAEEETTASHDERKEEDLPFDTVNKNMMEMLSNCCTAKELSLYRKFWFFLRSIPPGTISINEEGTVLLHQGREISTLSFIRECTKGTPPPASHGHGKKRKINAVTRLCIPFVAELLKHSSFPQHLISNQVLLKLARMYME